MQLHTPTLLVVSTLLSALLGVMWLCVAWNGTRVRGVAYWGLANLALAAGALLGSGRDMLHPFLSIDIANAILLVSVGVCWCAARRFDDRSAKLGWALAGAAGWLLLRRLPGLTDTVEARVVIASTMTAAYILLTAFEFYRRRADGLPFRDFIAGAFALHGLLVALRGVVAFLQPEWAVTTALPTTPWFAIALVEAVGHYVLTSFALLAMIREREHQRALGEIALSRDAADRANAAKSRFLARMSHELRTPLNGVLGLAQIVSADRSLPEATRGHAAVIERAGRHLLALVNDVLDLSQVEAGKLVLDNQPVPLARLLDSAAVLLQPEAARKRIRMEVSLAPFCPATVQGDELRLRQLLLNLLGNAVKFTPEDGTVVLALRALPAPPGQPSPGIRIEVIDTGPGIPPEQRNRLFLDFSRVVRPGQGETPREGHGLGLAISAALVEAMGGRIGMLPGPGQRGSLFWAELPLPEVSTPPLSRPAPGTRPRVLVVDDVALNRLVVQALLQPAGYAVEMAASGPEALAALAAAPAALVLMDVQMSGMDGLETTRHIRAREAALGTPRMPIVALTGEATPEEASACLAAGMDAHLPKPVDRVTLLGLARRMIVEQEREGVLATLSGAA